MVYNEIKSDFGKAERSMKEYELLIQTINPCGGEAHDKKEFLEVEVESPEAYVKANAAYPIMDSVVKSDGDVVITTGDGKGNFVKYIFTE